MKDGWEAGRELVETGALKGAVEGLNWREACEERDETKEKGGD